MFPVVEAVEEGGEGPQVHEVGAEPQQVGGDAVEFAGDHPDELGPFRDLELQELLHRHAVALVVGQGVQVIHPAQVRQELRVVAILGHVLVAPVAVPDDRLRLE